MSPSLHSSWIIYLSIASFIKCTLQRFEEQFVQWLQGMCAVRWKAQQDAAFVCKRQCFFFANITAMTIQDKNDMPTKSTYLKILKPEIKISELMHPLSETLTIISGGKASLNSGLLSLAFENHEGRYEVTNGTATSRDSHHSFLCIHDLLHCFSTFLSQLYQVQNNAAVHYHPLHKWITVCLLHLNVLQGSDRHQRINRLGSDEGAQASHMIQFQLIDSSG